MREKPSPYLHLPRRLSILYSSAVVVGLICIVLYGFFVWDTQIVPGVFNLFALLMTFLFASPFITSSVLLIRFLKYNFPSRPIHQILRILYFLSVLASTVVIIMLITYTIDTVRFSPPGYVSAIASEPTRYFRTGALFLMMFLQLMNNLEGLRLLWIIRRNVKSEYRDSF